MAYAPLQISAGMGSNSLASARAAAGLNPQTGNPLQQSSMGGFGEPSPVQRAGSYSMGASSSSEPAAAADPFASQRGQYQTQLSGLMGGVGDNAAAQDINAMRQAAQPQDNQYMDMLQKLMTDPSSITMTPGSQFAMQQANQGLERSMAAKGMLGSGNILSELQKQSQGIASQDYGNQLQQLMSAAGLQSQQQGQHFNELGAVAGASQGQQANLLGTLTTLSGANQGSPAGAGGLLEKLMSAQQGAGQMMAAAPGTNLQSLTGGGVNKGMFGGSGMGSGGNGGLIPSPGGSDLFGSFGTGWGNNSTSSGGGDFGGTGSFWGSGDFGLGGIGLSGGEMGGGGD